MGVISQADYQRLSADVAKGGSAAASALSQLTGNTVAPAAPSYTPPPTSSSSSSSSSSMDYTGHVNPYTGTVGNAPAPASSPSAVHASSPNYTSQSPVNAILPQLPSWMGTQYKPVSGTNYYSTNPSSPNSEKFYADGTPVPSIGYSDQKTGVNFDGYGTPQQFQQIMSAPDAATKASVVGSLVNSGSLVSNDSIYGNKGAGNIAATAYASPPVEQGTMAKLTPDQQSAQDWINNQSSGQGGLANYVNTQQQRYSDAVNAGDTNLISRLQADAQRVGYTLQGNGASAGQSGQSGAPPGSVPAAAAGGAGNATFYNKPYDINAITNNATASINDEIAKQIQAYNQQLATSQQANNNAVSQNNTSLDQQLAKLNDQKSIDKQDAITLQNRRGGFYSGGLDYQLGSLDKGYATQQGNIQADTQQRNQALWSNNATLAQQAADKISLLQQQAPDQIRKLIQDQINTLTDQSLKERAQANQDALTQNTINNTKFDQQSKLAQQHIDLADKLTQAFGVPVTPTDDPMLSYAQVAGLTTLDAQKVAADAANMSFDNAIKKALAENTINKTQADIMQQARQVDISQQNANTSAKNADTSALNAQNTAANNNISNLYKQWEYTGKAPAGIPGVQEGTPYRTSTTTANTNSIFDTLSKMYTTKDASTGQLTVDRPYDLASAIVSMHLSDQDTINLLNDFKLPMNFDAQGNYILPTNPNGR